VIDSSILDKLTYFYVDLNNSDEAAKYIIMSIDLRRNIFKQNISREAFQNLCIFALKNLEFLEKIGKFNRCETIFRELIRIGIDMLPEDKILFLCVEAYSNIRHQQGKTLEGISELEEYTAALANLEEASPNLVLIYRRLGFLYFLKDLFEESLKYFVKAKELAEDKRIAVSLQQLCDLATVHWELSHSREAVQIQLLMKQSNPGSGDTAPLTRSRYLTTLDCSLSFNRLYFWFILSLRVNRESPYRKEDEVDTINRRLDKCFLRVKFEGKLPNPELPCVNLTLKGDETTFFTIESPQLPFEQFYEVIIDIFEDETQANKLGTHHQIVYSSVK